MLTTPEPSSVLRKPRLRELDAADLAKVNRALVDLGYAVVPEELLERDYDGPSRLPWHVQRPSWWHRFFGTF
ncbi:hypothetical protein [Streptomyces chiangmaiensis]|uniref:Uncharacterized protein n=1 Tax=Streptomyces chiangmaiensis TaxID=766497 RepID=A0ABU7FXS9_9ACTN|nr:hypothetical protein [Streptomyces chiangmaiensis]MED7828896.1 hypothetical protein [Streptomyces chiangmaiensis]